MRTITVLNPKGGCGKTTIATCLAARDWEEWKPLMRWVEGKRSQPKN